MVTKFLVYTTVLLTVLGCSSDKPDIPRKRFPDIAANKVINDLKNKQKFYILGLGHFICEGNLMFKHQDFKSLNFGYQDRYVKEGLCKDFTTSKYSNSTRFLSKADKANGITERWKLDVSWLINNSDDNKWHDLNNCSVVELDDNVWSIASSYMGKCNIY